MISVSLCMIVKNEETLLGQCLSPVCGLVDEIVIVDTGSTDHTKELALRLERPREDRGARPGDYWSYLPSLECAVCDNRLGNYEESRYYNELAAMFKPGSPPAPQA